MMCLVSVYDAGPTLKQDWDVFPWNRMIVSTTLQFKAKTQCLLTCETVFFSHGRHFGSNSVIITCAGNISV